MSKQALEQLDALRELLAKVEAGEWTGLYKDLRKAGLAMESYDLNRSGSLWDAYNGSLDAAKALHEAVLTSIDPQYGYLVGPQYAGIAHPSCGVVCDAQSETPARAWLIAILKALIATTSEGGEQ